MTASNAAPKPGKPTKASRPTPRKTDPETSTAATPASPASAEASEPKKAQTTPQAKAKPKAAPAPEAATQAEAKPAPGEDATAASAPDNRYRRQDLIQSVTERSMLKRGDVKLVIDLALEELGRAIDTHDELALKPFGKFMVKKRDSAANGSVLTTKVKRDDPAPQKPIETPLADPDAGG